MTKYSHIIERMTLEQKATLVSAGGGWSKITAGESEISGLAFSDGRFGVKVAQGLKYHGAPATRFPAPINMARTWNTPLVARVADDIGNEARSLGVNALTTPEGGVITGVSSDMTDRFSEDPYLSGRMLTAYVRGIEYNKAMATVSYASAAVSTEFASNEQSVREVALMPYEMAIKDGKPSAVKVCDGFYGDSHVCESKHLMSGILKTEWKNDGIISVPDDGRVSIVKALAEGADLFRSENAAEEAQKIVKMVQRHKKLAEDVEDGVATPYQLEAAVARGEALSEKLLDEVVEKLLGAADEKHMKDIPVPESYASYPFNHPVMFEERKHAATAYEAAYESIVLLKNEGVLPIDDQKKVAFLGDYLFCDLCDVNADGSFVALENESTVKQISKSGLNVIGCYRGYERGATSAEQAKLLADAKTIAVAADVVVVYVGDLGNERSNGSIPSYQREFIRRIKESTNAKIVAVCLGNGLADMSWDTLCDAVILAGDPGQAGAKALLKVINGTVNPSAKLTVSVCDDKIPVDADGGLYGYRMCQAENIKERYPFGYGLSYTKFEYKDLKVTKRGVGFTLKNVGEVAGAEIAQLYVGKMDSEVTKAKKQLRGFKKIYLEPGESVHVEIPFDSRAFRYYNTDTNSWEIEGGKYQVMVGASARHMKLFNEIDIATSGAKPPVVKKVTSRTQPAMIKRTEKIFSGKALGNAIAATIWAVFFWLLMPLYGLIVSAPFYELLSALGATRGMMMLCDFVVLTLLFCVSAAIALYGIKNLTQMVKKHTYEVVNPAVITVKENDTYLPDAEHPADAERFHFDDAVANTSIDDVDEEVSADVDEAQANEPSLASKETEPSEEARKYMCVSHTTMDTLNAGANSIVNALSRYVVARGIIVNDDEIKRLFAAVCSSRVIVLRNSDALGARLTLKAMSECFGFNIAFINVGADDERISFSSSDGSAGIVDAVNVAIEQPEKPTFTVICGKNTEDACEFLGDIINYSGLGNAEYRMVMGKDKARSVKLPSNLWFVMLVSDEINVRTGNACVSLLHATFNKLVNVNDVMLGLGEEKAVLDLYPMTQRVLADVTAREREANYLSEKYWRKIDKLEEYMAQRAGFTIGNKLYNAMEKYSAVCIGAGADPEQAMDSVISSLLLTQLNSEDASKLGGEETLSEFMDSVFGADKDDRCREILRLKGIK